MRDTLVAFVFVQTQFPAGKAASLLARIPEVEELHRIAGEDCYLLRVRVSNTEQLGRLVGDKIEQIETVHSTRTTLVLRTLKDKQAHQLKGARQERLGQCSGNSGGVDKLDEDFYDN